MRRLLAIVAVLCLAALGCAEPPRPKSAVLIVLDTLRADRLTVYGHDRPTSPRLAELAEKGVLFEQAITNAPWTLPALAAMLAGQYPTAEVYEDGLKSSLVEVLRDGGWKTAAFTEGGFASRHFGIDAGFDDFREQSHRAFAMEDEKEEPDDYDSAKTFAWAIEWLERVGDEPFFLLLHTYEPHMPYRQTTFAEELSRGSLGETFEILDQIGMALGGEAPGPEELEYIRALYDGGVLAADRLVGELLDALEALGLEKETLVVVTSDHGEDLGHRDPMQVAKHGHTLYDELLHVPLILHDPVRDYPFRRVEAQVRTVDVLPTILDLLGLPETRLPYGRSLVPMMLGEETEDRLAFARLAPHTYTVPRLLLGIRSSTHKLIVEPTGEGKSRREIYDLRRDPGERENLVGRERDVAQRHYRELREIAQDLRSRGIPRYGPAEDAPEDEVREQLRALGYIED
jgi:arylsulfatase A-like enzyme